jgi:hypothetical protein
VINTLVILIGCNQISNVVCESFDQNRIRTLLKEIGVTSLGVFENEADSDLILRIFDKIRVFS